MRIEVAARIDCNLSEALMAAHPTLTLAGRTFTASCLATAVCIPLDGGEPLQLIAGAWLPLRDPGEPARLVDGRWLPLRPAAKGIRRSESPAALAAL
jgi:hypothetical protein